MNKDYKEIIDWLRTLNEWKVKNCEISDNLLNYYEDKVAKDEKLELKEQCELLKEINEFCKIEDLKKVKEKVLELLISITPNQPESKFTTAFMIASDYSKRNWKTLNPGFLTIYENDDYYLFERNTKSEEKDNVCLIINKNDLFNMSEFKITDDLAKNIIEEGKQLLLGDIANLTRTIIDSDKE